MLVRDARSPCLTILSPSSSPIAPLPIPSAPLTGKNGPKGIRTPGHLVKSQMLYLAELWAHKQSPGGERYPLNTVYIRCGGPSHGPDRMRGPENGDGQRGMDRHLGDLGGQVRWGHVGGRGRDHGFGEARGEIGGEGTVGFPQGQAWHRDRRSDAQAAQRLGRAGET